MYATIVTLSLFLVSQPPADAPLVPIESTQHRTSPAEIVAAALTLPDGATLTGRPLTLLQALSAARDSRQQLEVTHAYWRLARAVAEYRLGWEQHQQLERIEARPEEAAILDTARASSLATLRVAEAWALSAQHELAEAAALPGADPLPLPADLPHVGTYQTYFDEVFSMRNPPSRARLIDRSLPIRRQAIEVRASAVQAARDARQAAIDAYQLGSADLWEVLSSLRRWDEQSRAMLASVCDYNHDIADYALSVAGPQSDGQVVVAMLIGPARDAAQPSVPREASAEAGPPSAVEDPSLSRSEVQPATLNEPASTPDAGESETPPLHRGLRPVGKEAPTLAPVQEPTQAESTDEPTAAQWRGQSGPSVTQKAQEAAATEPAQAPKNESADAVPSEEAESAEPAAPEEPEAPAPPGVSEPIPRTTNRPVVDDQVQLMLQPSLEFYPALVDAKPAVRPKLLSEELHGRRTLPDPDAQTIQLRECLAELSGGDRRQVIAAYWLAAQRAAAYRALADQVNWLDALAPVALDRRHEPFGAEAMLELRAAKLAAEADLVQSHLDLVTAQFELTERAGRRLEGPWLLPGTVPHAGPYRLKLEAQPRELVESRAVRRLVAVIPALGASLEDRAAAVVQADTARAAATRAYESGTQPILPVLASIQSQTRETIAFLETLTKYNEAIADYALAVLPATIPAEQLAGTLVVIR